MDMKAGDTEASKAAAVLDEGTQKEAQAKENMQLRQSS